jgi:hypothetical protein
VSVFLATDASSRLTSDSERSCVPVRLRHGTAKWPLTKTSGQPATPKMLIRPWPQAVKGALPHSIPRTRLTCSSNPFGSRSRLVEGPVPARQEPLPPEVPSGSQPSDGPLEFNDGIIDSPPTLMTPASEFDWLDDYDLRRFIAAYFTANPQSQADGEAEDDLPPPGNSPNAE